MKRPMMEFRALTPAIAAAVLVLGCDGGTSPPSPPSRIEIVNGSGQTAVVASALAVQPTVKVVASSGKAVPKVAVTFQVGNGSGSVSVAAPLTDGNGMASAGVWTLGTRAGQQTLTAMVEGVPVVTFTASASAAEAAKLVLITEPPAGANNEAPLSTQPVVQVADQFGNAVAGAGVLVTAQAGSARITNGQATTETNGAASFSTLTLGGASGVYTLRFSAPTLGFVDASSAIVLAAGSATQLTLVSSPPPSVENGVPFGTQTVLEIRDADGNRVAAWAQQVSAVLASGSGSLAGTTAVSSTNGQAVFADLKYNGLGTFRVTFTSHGLPSVASSDITAKTAVTCTGARALTLDFTLGQMARFATTDPASPNCLRFDWPRNVGEQYLVMIENMPLSGSYNAGVFPGPNLNPSPVTVTVSTAAPSSNLGSMAASKTASPAGTRHSWDFGAGPIYELEPVIPAGGIPAPVIVRGANRIGVNSVNAEPAVGDTVMALLQGIPRLGLLTGTQRAVIRYVSNELIIAEDVRLSTTLTRQGGTHNTPMMQADLDSIGSAYARHAKAQGDLLFGGRYNHAIEVQQRVLAVHTLMPADNIWGYTYMSGSTFAFDYWVNSNGSTKGVNQHPLRNAHNLFTHEIAHMRHYGWLERGNRTELRGNQWLIEGFARFTERLPIAAHLLGQANPSRTGNVVLPRYTEFSSSFRDDVPTYMSAGSSMFDGYQSSSYVFDYFADQVAAAGGDWRTAVASLITNAGTQVDLDAAIAAALPGLDFPLLFTRARIALYTDDLPTPGLPDWTQYLQFQLRASRPAGTASGSDPHNSWPRVTAGTPFQSTSVMSNGGAFGYLIDGSGATSGMRVRLDYTADNGIISITRIR